MLDEGQILEMAYNLEASLNFIFSLIKLVIVVLIRSLFLKLITI